MDFLDQVKATVDIVAVVRDYVSLKKAGTRWVGLCPFHSERTPSFGVHPVHQFYKCFGCGKGGDAINFVMEIEGLTFWEALTLLAERNGIPVPTQSRYSDQEGRLRAGIQSIHEVAGSAFRKALESSAGAAARAYLRDRGVSEASAAEFGLGFADRNGQMIVRHLERAGFSADQMEASGLVARRQDGSGIYDRFRGRLIFPIANESGKTIAFAARALKPGDEPKYLNSPETPIYRKSEVLYNLHRARKAVRDHGRAILVEGYMDVIGLHAAGIFEVVASCGTSLTPQQVRTLRRHSGKTVVNFDPDAAGVAAAERSVQLLLEEGIHVRVLELDGGLDPDEFVRAHGAPAYLDRLEHAPNYFHWLADHMRKSYDMNSAEARVDAFRAVLLPAIQRVPDKLERAAVAEEVASYLRVDPGLVRREFRKTSARAADPARPAPANAVDAKEKLLISLMLNDLDARAQVIPRL
ncbi:MAG TPA: DNA primase, partial [Phycisphaerae bacterium]|nr:DNA primase [Phycisphaerae bacterium]